jgi:hypothetical protein
MLRRVIGLFVGEIVECGQDGGSIVVEGGSAHQTRRPRIRRQHELLLRTAGPLHL